MYCRHQVLYFGLNSVVCKSKSRITCTNLGSSLYIRLQSRYITLTFPYVPHTNASTKMIGYVVSRLCWQCTLFLFQPISLGIFRSDYLIDKSDGLDNRCSDYSGEVTPKPANGSIFIKQVEMNTISLGGITFSCFVPKMHRYSSERGVRPARFQSSVKLSNNFFLFFFEVLLICHRIKFIYFVRDWFEVQKGRWFFI